MICFEKFPLLNCQLFKVFLYFKVKRSSIKSLKTGNYVKNNLCRLPGLADSASSFPILRSFRPSRPREVFWTFHRPILRLENELKIYFQKKER